MGIIADAVQAHAGWVLICFAVALVAWDVVSGVVVVVIIIAKTNGNRIRLVIVAIIIAVVAVIVAVSAVIAVVVSTPQPSLILPYLNMF